MDSAGSLYFATAMDDDRGLDLFVSERVGAGFGVPRRLPGTVNSAGLETNPAISPDGRFLVFQGARRVRGPGDQDLWVSAWGPDGWGEARRLPEPVNTDANEGFPSFSPDGRFLFFASDRGGDVWAWSVYLIEVDAAGVEAVNGEGGGQE